jgi:hypothetical protein
MTNQFPNGELRPTGKQTDRENLSTSGLPATPLLLRCMSPFLMLWTAPPPARECHGSGGY